ncbi:MAG: precorrin-6A reductase [Treponemataceae bacterium]|nr:precorrin-6A reductase [Treponemataceae bacterium]
MSRILLFGGTSEGHVIAELLSAGGIECDLCVATEYGSMVMEDLPFVTVRTGRLSAKDIARVIECGEYDAAIDATHPFAVEASENIRKSTQGKLPLIRFERNTSAVASDGCIYENNPERCAEELEKTEGKILLTTGSKELALFCRKESLRKRLVVRVLPGMESLRLCYEAGLEGRQIIAMQGPFSEKMNRLLIEEYGISALVMKESGRTGGADEKISAARKAGIPCYVIRHPEGLSQDKPEGGRGSVAEDTAETSSRGTSVLTPAATCDFQGETADFSVVSDYDQLRHLLEKYLSSPLSFKSSIKVSLAGIGPGGRDSMTTAVKSCLAQADCVFGAPRMLESAGVKGLSYPYYLAADIIPVLEKLGRSKPGRLNAVVLFSGDPGFFSGAEKLRQALSSLPFIQVEVLPGVSSLQYLAAKFGLSWQNWAIMSMHGLAESDWLPLLQTYVKAGRDVFFLTSGAADVRRLGELASHFIKSGMMTSCRIFLGYQLSYPDERIKILSPEECLEEDGKGLYSGILIPDTE